MVTWGNLAVPVRCAYIYDVLYCGIGDRNTQFLVETSTNQLVLGSTSAARDGLQIVTVKRICN
jgi:hypothetical protein